MKMMMDPHETQCIFIFSLKCVNSPTRNIHDISPYYYEQKSYYYKNSLWYQNSIFFYCIDVRKSTIATTHLHRHVCIPCGLTSGSSFTRGVWGWDMSRRMNTGMTLCSSWRSSSRSTGIDSRIICICSSSWAPGREGQRK